MLKHTGAFVLAVAFVAAMPIPIPKPSQPPIPSPPVKIHTKQQPSGDDQKGTKGNQSGTENSPLVVKVLSTPKSQAVASEDADYQERKTADDGIVRLGWIEIAISIASSLIFLGQTIALIFTLRATNRANALNEEHFIETERPYLSVENIRAVNPITREWFDEGYKNKFFTAQYDLVSYGRSPAVVKEKYASVYIGTELPEFPTPNINDVFTNEFVMGAGAKRSGFRDAFYRGRIDGELLNEIFLSRQHIPDHVKTQIFVFGKIKYQSIGGGFTEEVGYIVEYLTGIDRFVEYENTNYNYRKRT